MRCSTHLLAPLFAFACAHAERPAPPPPPLSPRPQETSSALAPTAKALASAATELPPVAAAPEAGETETIQKPHPFQATLPPRELGRDAPALRIANLSPAACLSELRNRKLPVERDTGGAATGIAVPVRVTGAMHGVRFLAPGRKSVYGKLDCRLALVLDELAEVLARHEVVALRVDNLYRPNAHLPGRRTSSQHRYGLAIDIVSLELADGTELSIERDWHGDLEGPPCGPESHLLDPSPSAVTLRDIVCDVGRSGLFHHVLTPSYNEAHRDHVHLDIRRGEKRSVVE